MTTKIRSLSPQEKRTLARWQRGDDAVRYRHARVLLLASQSWACERIAEALGLHVNTVRTLINTFNQGGLEAVTPRPRSGGRPPTYGSDVGEAAEDLLRQGPPPEEGRATWTLHRLAQTLSDRLGHLRRISHETVRRLLHRRGITYRRAKAWLTSPDPAYTRHKHQRDRLLRLVRARPTWTAVWLDQSWFTRWPYRFSAWAPFQEPLRVPQRWQERVETTALYAALDEETQAAFLRWSEGQPNTVNTLRVLDALLDHYSRQGQEVVVLFWDHASWHTSRQTRAWIKAYNRRAKQERLTRLLVCYLPVRSPWLMPLEAIFGSVKHQVLGPRWFETLEALQGAVEQAFRARVAEAQPRRARYWQATLATAENSMSVL